jgi:hypothetical protein
MDTFTEERKLEQNHPLQLHAFLHCKNSFGNSQKMYTRKTKYVDRHHNYAGGEFPDS